MFAHQVIEDLKKLDDCGYYQKSWANLVPLIKKSQCFHMGDINDVLNSVKHEKGNIFIDNASFMRLPHKFCWFDAVTNDANDGVLKFGAIIFNYDEHVISAIIFIFPKIKPVWMLVPIESVFNIEKEFTTEQIKKLFPGTKPPKFQTSDGCFSKMMIKPLIPGIGDKVQNMADIGTKYLTAIENTILLLNCKNIQTEKIKAPEALNKKRRKNGKQEIFDYHVLNVVVPGKKRGYSPETEPLSHNRVHLCRGHFKEYTSEHPLFGHHTGLYWWQPHVRGQNKSGIVVKDYNVKTA